MPGEEYNYIPGDLARQDLYPDERGFQPPPPPDAMFMGMSPEQVAGLSGPGMPMTGSEKLLTGPAHMVQNFVDTTGAYQPGVRREDYTDVPAQGGWGSFGSQPNDPAIGASTDVSASLMGTGTAFAQPGAAGIFGGRLAKTANLDALKQAELMDATGESINNIRDATGWFRGTDDKWRFEIPDYNSRWIKGMEPSKLPKGQSATIEQGGAFSHPELWDAYPTLENAPLRISPLGKDIRGGYQPPLDVGDTPKFFLSPGSGKGMRSVNLHELQHGVQDIEDFAVGGNPARPIVEGTPQWDIYQRLRADATAPLSFEQFLKMGQDMGGYGLTKADYEKYLVSSKEIQLLPSTEERLKQLAASEGYRRMAGEVESRNVQARADFKPAQLASIPPHVSQDFSRGTQIVEFRDRSPNMGSLADQSMQLSTKDPGLTGFAPGPKGTGRPLASPEEITRAAAESRQGMTQPELRQLYDQLGLTGGAPSELVSKSLARSQPASAIEEATRLKLADREVLNSLTPDQRLAYQKGKPLPKGITLPSQEAVAPALEKYLPIKKEVARAEKEFDKGPQLGSLFDLSPQTLNKIPDVPQYPLPRVAPKETARLEPAARGGLARIERAAAAAPEENWGWYNLMQQRDLMHQLHGPVKGEQAFNALLDSTAGTSMLNPIDNNLRSATWYLQQVMQGKPLPQVLHITDPATGQTVKTMAGGPPPGYGAKSQIQHADRVREYMSNQYDPVANPKPISYRTNLSGNYVPRTVDTHDIRNIVGMPGALKAFGENSTLLPGEYTHLEDVGARAAKRAGTPQAPQQAATWVGGGEYTGLKSYPAPLAAAINRRAHVTAKVRGQTPEQALEDAFTGKMPLLGIGGAAAVGGLAAQDDYR